MRRVILLLILTQISLVHFGQIIADHTVVDRFDDIPQLYIDKVKEMWVVVAGESHSAAYRTGAALLETSFSAYQVNVTESGTPEAATNQRLRLSRGTWGDVSNSSGWIYSYGEEDWFTNSTAIARTKAGITYCNTHNLTIAAIGFGWCWDMVYGGPSVSADPVFGCKWYGSSINGPNGDNDWGLDAADNSITGNSVCMDTYLSVTQQYIDYCATSGYSTKVFFTTGPVDTYYNQGEGGYQGYIKHEYIRNFVKADPTRVLFDYADILCYDNNGSITTAIWNGHTFPRVTSINGSPEETGHISNAGALRLAKAMWWMLARMAGWNGTVTGIEKSEAIESLKVIVDNKSDEIKVYLSDSFQNGEISLYNLHGILIEKKSIDNNTLKLNRSNVPSGIYFVTAKKSKLRETRKIIVVN